MTKLSQVAFFASVIAFACAQCPHMDAMKRRDTIRLENSAFESLESPRTYKGMEIFSEVKEDIRKALKTPREEWPADYGHYGGLMIRGAWHCAGTYRKSDGRGGCDGARPRFAPELEWEDNGNLDNSRIILEPIKEKYGDDLSWADLLVLTGNVAIEDMGGPVLGFCGGRMDDADGTNSLPLGPSTIQEAIKPCPVNGKCETPLGQTKIGLIYVNPEGVMDEPDPEKSVHAIRDSFGRMGMNDSETVVLIGGGHTYGKAHGACEDPPCGEGEMKGKGNNTVTSGLEGPWTTTPTQWDQEYFTNLLKYDWVKFKGPGGRYQFKPSDDSVHIQMFTTDVALLHDESYLALVRKYATDKEALDNDFKYAWYKLVTRDMGPRERCHGEDIPPAQPFQNPLPEPSSATVDVPAIKGRIAKLLRAETEILEGDKDTEGKPYYGALLVHLAYQCASTFRITDYKGGCNGAAIRFVPQKDWPENVGMDKVLEFLGSVHADYPDMSWADLIVLAGEVALVEAGGEPMDFNAVRSDAVSGEHYESVELRDYYVNATVAVRDSMDVMGLTPDQFVALMGRPRSNSQMKRIGLLGSYDTDPSHFTNEYYQLLLNSTWVQSEQNEHVYIAEDSEGVKIEGTHMTDWDMVLINVPELKEIVSEFAADEKWFKEVFAEAWVALMRADLF